MDLALIQTALELGLICSLTVLALFLSYSMLNVCDLSTDGCFTLGAAVGAGAAVGGAVAAGTAVSAAVQAVRVSASRQAARRERCFMKGPSPYKKVRSRWGRGS